jgi:hypothetical protein
MKTNQCKIHTIMKVQRKSFNSFVVILALGSRPRQGLAKVQAKSEACESHFVFPKMWESVRE